MPQHQEEYSQLPSAPYPPMTFKPPTKSSMASSPHYSSNYRGNESMSANPPRASSPLPSSNPRETLSESENEGAVGASRQQYADSLKTARVAVVSASQLQFYPSSGGLIACINTAAAIPSTASTIGADENFKSRKLGPSLLELRRLVLPENIDDTDESFVTQTLAISRGNPQLGTSVCSTCMDLPVVQNYSSQPRAATGLTTGMLAIHTFSETSGADGLPYSSAIEYYHTSRHHRQSSAVSWRTNQSNHVAIGLLGSGAPGGQQGNLPRRGGSTIRGGSGGDREFCCFLWDIEAQQSTVKRNAVPVAKLSHNTPVSSLAWVLDGQTLAIGTQSRNVQLYDMRVTGTNAPPLSALAHNFGVHGIEVDPFRPFLMATFCRSPGEPVKVWDIRRMDSVVSEIKISGAARSRGSQTSSAETLDSRRVEAAKWSKSESGVISVAIGDCIHDYDTSSGSRPVLLRVNYARERSQIKDFALYGGTTGKTDNIPNDKKDLLVEALYARRALVMSEDRTIYDMAKHGGQAPVAISRRDGRLVHALGGKVWIGSTTSGPSAMEKSDISYDEDVSATMMRRARCLRVSRYSMNTSSNIKMLSEDTPNGTAPTKQVLLSRLTLLKLWSWIERIESLSTELGDSDEYFHWPTKGLLDSGIMNLLEFGGLDSKDEVVTCDTLCCNVYTSPGRKLAMTSCGWAGKFSLDNVMADCEALGEYERSAALAVWHGDIGAAVGALQRASAVVRDHFDGNKAFDFSFATPTYAETLDLIAMCVAGYVGSISGGSSVWQNACSLLLRRDDLADPETKTSRTVYLRALCKFLLSMGTEESLDYVLENEYLAYGDRIAFACRFLEKEHLVSYLDTCLGRCQRSGNVEGIVIAGLSREGIKILQAFVDRTSDVQTSALVVSRVFLPADWVVERKVCMEWIEAYRNLLNTWQMWQSRAMFDVDRAEALRRIKAKGSELASNRRSQVRRLGSRPQDVDALTSIPAALDARCNYCSSPLGLRRHDGNANQWLSKMKPVLSCCPQCRKPLPRCAICLLSLGALNPYMELTRERSRLPSRVGNPANSLDDLAALPLAEWFTWCMNCKHGGHAHHLVGWFANHETCPVSGCDCHCQFDGMQKLSRPSLAQNPKTGLGD